MSADEAAVIESTVAEAAVTEAAAEPSLRMAPVRYGILGFGNLDYYLRYNGLMGGRGVQQTMVVNVGGEVRAESFILQPYFATVGAHMRASLGLNFSAASPDNNFNMVRNGESVNRVITGGSILRVFPRSRFPFEASFERSDNRTDYGLVNERYASLTDNYKLSQSYRNYSGRSRYLLTYNFRRSQDNQSQINGVRLLNLDVSLNPTPRQTLQINGVRGRNDNSMNGLWFNDLLAARHSYRVSATASLATMASFTSYRTNIIQETRQFSSAGTWRPMDSKLTMTGGVRLFTADNVTAGTRGGYTGANLGASYALTNWLRLYGSLSVQDENGAQTVSSTTISNLSVAAQHRFATTKLWNFNYSRDISANLSNNTSTVTGASGSSATSQVFTLKMGHGLQSTTLMGQGKLMSSLGQRLTSTSSSNSLPSSQLLHSGTMAWQKGSGSVRLSAADSRALGGTRGYVQSVNIQASQSERRGGGVTVGGNLSVNASKSGYDAAAIPTTDSLTTTAGLNYAKSRVLGVRNLNFVSTLSVISADLLQSNDLGQNDQNQGQYLWDNNLTYAVGKIRIELKGLVEETQSVQRATILFHLSRVF